MAGTLRTRLVEHVSVFRRSLAIGAGVLLAIGAGTYAGVAGAAQQPTIGQVQAKVNRLTSEFNRADEQYDVVAQQLTQARARLKQVNKEFARNEAEFTTARKKVAAIASAAYEDSNATSLAGLLTTSNASTVLSEASLLLEVAGSNNAQTQIYLSSAQQLKSVQQEQQRTELGIAQLAAQREQQKNSIEKLLASEKSTLDSLTQQQQQEVTQPGTSTTGPEPVYTGPTTTEADKAIAYVYAQLGCPYVYGSTGPCADGFDCSGLVMSAWSSAGVTIPRDTYEQWAALPHIPLSQAQPGDLFYYNGIGHVAMYVGDGYIIDAPQPGQDVERIPESTPWYVQNFDGVAVP